MAAGQEQSVPQVLSRGEASPSAQGYGGQGYPHTEDLQGMENQEIVRDFVSLFEINLKCSLMLATLLLLLLLLLLFIVYTSTGPLREKQKREKQMADEFLTLMNARGKGKNMVLILSAVEC